MSLLEWKPGFSVGIAEVDHEHQELIALINRLHQDLEQDASRERLLDFIGELYAKISAHFALEEKIMRETRYDQLREHKQDHEALLDELTDLIDDVGDDRAVLSEQLAERLNAWFSVHFRTHDARWHQRME